MNMLSQHIKKARPRIKQGWLRVYAIRVAQNCYLVTGGAIKLTNDMRRKHLHHELMKLDKAKALLRNTGIYYPEDLNTFYDE